MPPGQKSPKNRNTFQPVGHPAVGLLPILSRVLSGQEVRARTFFLPKWVQGSLGRRLSLTLLLASGFVCLGCSTVTVHPAEPKTLLARPRMNPGSCAVEVFFVRAPEGSPTVNEELWREIDDSRIAPEVRQLLWANGFRVGVVGTCVPPTVAHLFDLRGQSPPPADGTAEATPVGSELSVVKRHLQVPPRENRQIALGEPCPEVVLFVAERSGVRGRTFSDAQSFLTLWWEPLPQGQLCLNLVPEICFGQPRTKYAAAEGHFRLDVVRPRETFQDLRLTARLLPGEMLVLGCWPDRPGTLGHRFFIHNGQQKLIFIRVAQIQHDEVFQPEEFLRLAGVAE